MHPHQFAAKLEAVSALGMAIYANGYRVLERSINHYEWANDRQTSRKRKQKNREPLCVLR